MKRRAEELIAAYADGGLTPDEAAEVEALLAASPAARAELEAVRRLIAEARGAEDNAAEPDWDAMAREIQRACDQAPPPRFGWLRPRRMLAIGGLAAAATAAVLFVALGPVGDGGGAADRASRAAGEPAPPVAVSPPAEPEDPTGEDALPALREPEVDELSADELAQLDDELARGDLGDDGFIADLLTPGGEADGDGFDVFDDQPLTADELAEDLPPDAIEKLDRFLAEVSAG
jgi:anti-sigma factor RsiW